MNVAEIQTLLDARLATVTDLPALQKENTLYAPTTGTPFVRSTLIPVEPNAMSTAINELRGVLRVDLFYPLDRGVDDIAAMADAIISAFPRGLYLTGTEVALQVLMAWRETARRTDKNFQIPINIRWSSLQAR